MSSQAAKPAKPAPSRAIAPMAAAGTSLARMTPNRSTKEIRKYLMPFSDAACSRLTVMRLPPPRVIPAQAGIQYSFNNSIVYWIPACAGTTQKRSSRMFLTKRSLKRDQLRRNHHQKCTRKRASGRPERFTAPDPVFTGISFESAAIVSITIDHALEFRLARNPVRPGQRHAGHRRRLDRQRNEVFRLQIVDVALAAGAGDGLRFQRQHAEIIRQPRAARDRIEPLPQLGSCVEMPAGSRPSCQSS